MENDTDLMPRPATAVDPNTRGERDDREVLVPAGGEDFSKREKAVAVLVALAIALISFFPLADWASSPVTHADSIAKLDAKAQTVTALIGSSTAASVAITLLPDDVGTPIADKLVDVAADFAIVLGAIYLEKYLLTIASLAAFRVILPLACAAAAAAVAFGRATGARDRLFSVAIRLTLLALAAALVVPASVHVSTLIEDTYRYDASGVAESLGQQAQQTEDANAGSATGDADQTQSTEGPDSNASSDTGSADSSGNWFNDFIDWAGGLGQTVADAAASAAEGVTSGVTGVLDSAKAWVADLVEAFAVMIVTCCAIPILVLLFFIWLINVLLGLNIQVPTAAIGGMKGRLRRSSRPKAVRKA